jgi:hypothetical protein
LITRLAAAALLLALAACGTPSVQPLAHKKPAPAGPPPPPMPDTPLVCPTETRLCPDGRSVGRDPANECEFAACPVNSLK